VRLRLFGSDMQPRSVTVNGAVLLDAMNGIVPPGARLDINHRRFEITLPFRTGEQRVSIAY